MTLFRLLSAVALFGLLIAIAVDLRRRLGSWRTVWEFLGTNAKRPLAMMRRQKEEHKGMSPDRMRRIVYSCTLGLFIVLALTGFVPVIFLGEHLTGILLVVHVTVAPFFALALAGLAILWAHNQRFSAADWQIATGVWERQSVDMLAAAPFLLKKCFWGALIFSLPLILTVILELFPLFNTEGEELLIRLHGYSALLLALSVVVHTYLLALLNGHTETIVAKEEQL